MCAVNHFRASDTRKLTEAPIAVRTIVFQICCVGMFTNSVNAVPIAVPNSVT